MSELLRLHRESIIEITQKNEASNIRVIPADTIDLLMDFEKGRSLIDLAATKQEIEELLGCPVTVVTEQAIHPRIREGFLRNAKIL